VAQKLKSQNAFGLAARVSSNIMSDREELADDVPAADAAEQHRPVSDAGLDEEASAQPPTEPPLEVAAADWQEQLETVEIDPDEDRV